ncbi:hypothetical protein NIES593_19140 [Hydrococcus rivularis NIES-593]|uniref:Uncharacterized protein n=1 Tax=Hydrococcus rivularis NIES-593 TaxID=1921803 RepID=A0A1U7H9S3_9CYAN|nr:hypothetical protein NIES593_19140 [Hydrococcus rivularis NIES-593]
MNMLTLAIAGQGAWKRIIRIGRDSISFDALKSAISWGSALPIANPINKILMLPRVVMISKANRSSSFISIK